MREEMSINHNFCVFYNQSLGFKGVFMCFLRDHVNVRHFIHQQRLNSEKGKNMKEIIMS